VADTSRLPAHGRDADILRAASTSLAAGDLEGALAHLEAGLAGIEDLRFRPHYTYLLGTAAYGLGDLSSAVRWLEDTGPDPESGYFYDHSMLLAQVLIEAYAYEDALSIIDDLRAWYAGADRDSAVLLLSGIAYLESGDTIRAVEHLSGVTEEPAKAIAERLLAEIE
jgi:hypothetical protein